MSFLTPLYLFGIIAVGLPILLHLVRHQPKNVFLFSNLRFLEHKPPLTNRKSKIENWLLLLLRAVAVMLLVTAFARPFFKNRDLELTTESSIKQTILLIDTSSSMQRETLWKQVIEQAQAIIQQSNQNQIAIYTFDSGLTAIKAIKDQKHSDQDHIRKRNAALLSDLTPGWNSTDLGKALVEIASILQQQSVSESAENSLENSTIELITDFQAGSQIDALTDFSWPAELKVRLHRVQTKETCNAGLQLISLDEKSQATVRIVNAADSKQEQFTLAYQGNESLSKQVYVPRGQSRVVQMPAADEAHEFKQIILTGDHHVFDNRLYLQPREKTALTIVHYGVDSDSSLDSPDYFAKRAFPSTQYRDVDFLTVIPDSPKPLSLATEIHMTIVSRKLESHETKSIKTYLQQGGIVLISLNDEQSGHTLQPFLSQQDQLPAKSITESAEFNGYALLTNIQFDHAIFQIFQDPEYSDFTKLKFWNYQQLTVPEGVSHQVLARFDHQHPAIVNFPIGQGQLVVMTFGWTPQESQIALSTKFVPMMNAILSQNPYLNEVPSQYLVDDKAKLIHSQSATRIPVVDSSPIMLTAGHAEFKNQIQPGLYQISTDQKDVPAQKFAVNLNIRESNTAPLAPEKLESLGVKLQKPGETESAGSHQSDTQRHALIHEMEQRQQIWRWLIIAALVMLVLETLLAKWIAGKTSAVRKA